MIWLVWRQHRQQALFALLGLAVLAAFMIPTGLTMHREFERAGLDVCLAVAARVESVPLDPESGQAVYGEAISACQEAASAFGRRFGFMGTAGVLLWFLPLLVGLFWGAPLVAREIEHGTHRMVWTQGVSRTRWALAKFGLVGGGVLLVAAAYGLLVTWWRSPLDQVSVGPSAFVNRFFYFQFDIIGLAPVGYTLFALALGVAAGVLTRKSQMAMALTLVGFLATRLVVEFLARARFIAPEERTYSVAPTEIPGQFDSDWIVDAGVYDADGSRLAGGTFGSYTACWGPEANNPCVADYGEGAYNLEVFQPAERFWQFQGIEAALFTVLAVALLVAAAHLVRRRVT